eukprot:jgi/Mesvir1/28915/Mv18000-RA.1
MDGNSRKLEVATVLELMATRRSHSCCIGYTPTNALASCVWAVQGDAAEALPRGQISVGAVEAADAGFREADGESSEGDLVDMDIPDDPEVPEPEVGARTQIARGEPAARKGATGAEGSRDESGQMGPSSGRERRQETSSRPGAPDTRTLQLVKELNEETFNPRVFLRDYGREGEALLERRRRRRNQMPSELRADSIMARVGPVQMETFRGFVRRNARFRIETRTAARNGVVVGTDWETHERECSCHACMNTLEAGLAFPRLLLLLLPPLVRKLLERHFPRYLPPEGALRGEKCLREGQYSLRQALDRIVAMDDEDQDDGSEEYDSDSDDLPPRPHSRSPPRDPPSRGSQESGARNRPVPRYEAPPPATGWGRPPGREARSLPRATGWGGGSQTAPRRAPEWPARRRSPSPPSRSRSRSDSGTEYLAGFLAMWPRGTWVELSRLGRQKTSPYQIAFEVDLCAHPGAMICNMTPVGRRALLEAQQQRRITSGGR